MTPHEQSISATSSKRDHRQEVTDSIVKMLEEGAAPWQKPWESGRHAVQPNHGQGVPGRQCC